MIPMVPARLLSTPRTIGVLGRKLRPLSMLHSMHLAMILAILSSQRRLGRRRELSVQLGSYPIRMAMPWLPLERNRTEAGKRIIGLYPRAPLRRTKI